VLCRFVLNFVWEKAILSNPSAASIPKIHKPHCQLDLVLGRYSSFNLCITTEQSEIVAAPDRYVQRDYLPGFDTVTISIDENEKNIIMLDIEKARQM
jgi:hypothetical protein